MYFKDWERTTMPSSANWVVPDPVKSRGLNCGIHQDYKGKLRRIPPRHDDYNFRCEKTVRYFTNGRFSTEIILINIF